MGAHTSSACKDEKRRARTYKQRHGKMATKTMTVFRRPCLPFFPQLCRRRALIVIHVAWVWRVWYACRQSTPPFRQSPWCWPSTWAQAPCGRCCSTALAALLASPSRSTPRRTRTTAGWSNVATKYFEQPARWVATCCCRALPFVVGFRGRPAFNATIFTAPVVCTLHWHRAARW